MRKELTLCGSLVRYAAPLYVDIKKTIITRQPDGEEEEIEETYPKTFLGEVGTLPVRTQFLLSIGLSSKASCHVSDGMPKRLSHHSSDYLVLPDEACTEHPPARMLPLQLPHKTH